MSDTPRCGGEPGEEAGQALDERRTDRTGGPSVQHGPGQCRGRAGTGGRGAHATAGRFGLGRPTRRLRRPVATGGAGGGAAPTRQTREASRNDPSPTRTGARSLRRSAPHPGGTPRRAARAWRRGAPWPRSAVTRACRPWTRHTARARAGTSPRDGPRSRGCRLGRDGAAPVRGASAKTSAIPPSTS